MTRRSWIRKLFARTPRTVRKAPARFRPRFEALEDRVTPSAFYVTNSNDDLNPGSLRWAITQANANPGADTIDNWQNFGGFIAMHQIDLTLNGSQLPAITGDLSIVGHGTIFMSGNHKSRVLAINSGVTVNITGVTIENGSVRGGSKLDESGGGILNFGTLSIDQSTISDNRAAAGGGGIANHGTLTITNSTVSRNQAAYGGGILTQSAPNLATLTMINSTVSGNLAVSSGSDAPGVGFTASAAT
jgi:hypothetical protein